MKEEIWKDVVGYKGLYQVSSLGRVKSVERFRKGKNNSNVLVKEKILKPADNGDGYLTVGLCKDGKRTTKLVHRLVAEAFIPNTEKRDDVDHINTIRTDNRVENLRWTTRSENCRNPLSVEHYSENAPMKGKFGKEHHSSKQIIQYSIDGEFIKEWNSLMDVQRELGIANDSISKCCKGKYYTAGGYKWSYK